MPELVRNMLMVVIASISLAACSSAPMQSETHVPGELTDASDHPVISARSSVGSHPVVNARPAVKVQPALKAEPLSSAQSAVSDADQKLVAVGIQSTLPFHRRNPGEAVSLSSIVKLTAESDWVAYQIQYALEPGKALASDLLLVPGRPPPSDVARQQIAQEIQFKIPDLAGAPLLVNFSDVTQSTLMVDRSLKKHVRRADVSWSPGSTDLGLQWFEQGVASKNWSALACDVSQTVRMPIASQSMMKQSLVAFSNRCIVKAAGSAYQGVDAHTWGLSYSWEREQQVVQLQMTSIEPDMQTIKPWQRLKAAHDIGVSFKQSLEPWSLLAKVSKRQREYTTTGSVIESSPLAIEKLDESWMASAIFQWDLLLAKLRAEWKFGADSQWFAPKSRQPTSSFGMNLDLSKWLQHLTSLTNPAFQLRWKQTQVREADGHSVAGNKLDLKFELFF